MALKRMTRTIVAIVSGAAMMTGALTYLRDPPWLISVTSGLRAWEMDASGRRYRWMGGHASMFVPADARLVSLPVRTTFATPADAPVTVTIAVDDRPVDRVVLSDAQWRLCTFRLPPAGTRRVRRVDVRVDRTRDDNRGAAIGVVTTTPASR
jgi:hypothetical protein